MEAKALHCSREFQAPGGTQQMFIRGGPAQRFNPLPFYIFFFHEKSSPFEDLLLTNVPLSHTLLRSLHPLTAVNALSFK